MTKKHPVGKNKASSMVRSGHESEILRAKRAVSAALNAGPVVSEPVQGGASTKAVMSGDIPAVDSISTAATNPLAELAHLHIIRSGESLSRSAESERLCRKVLANLARARLDSIEQNPSQTTRT